MNLGELLAARHMTRSFDPRPLDSALLEELCLLARRAPSAGFAQGTEFIILEGPETLAAFWDLTLPPERRSGFAWPGLLQAPALVLPAADSRRYLARYREGDKASGTAGGLGESTRAWPVPYWLIDCAFVVQNLLLAATERGLGALFFGLFDGEAEVRAALRVPEGVELLGVVALGRPAPDRPSSSLARGWRDPDEILHWGCWSAPRR
ncbi:MAG: nitroreductase family protein [Acidimicrobiia bacterium]|nr:nitroreductase family protein [Acidimicrobiia bacterium]MYC46561.1 nitroreductase family protein [Acidimicrobiia bacterium]MYI20717.1 nitroreductase family protein [Acidimicrobiia bacterium]